MNTTAASEKIGFIGLGLMGHGIAKNIVDKGYSLTFLGRKNRKPAEDLLGRGAAEASTPREVAASFAPRPSRSSAGLRFLRPRKVRP